MKRLKLALFDVDGTLVDSQGHIKLAMTRAFEAENQIPPPPEAVLGIVGLSLPIAIAKLAPGIEPDIIERMVEAYKDAYSSLRGEDAAASSPLYPGALECLNRLTADSHVLLGVATGKSRRGLSYVLALHGLSNWFDTIQVADNHPSKPHPSMIEAALWETGVEPRDAVMIGDTTFDMEMGRAAGVSRLGVTWGYHRTEDLEPAGAELLAHSFDEVPDKLTQLMERADD